MRVQEEVESPDVHFEPVVKLAPVELKTNEEEEKELFKMCAIPLSLPRGRPVATVSPSAGGPSFLGLTTVQKTLSGRREVWET